MQLKQLWSKGKLFASETTLLTLKIRLQLCFRIYRVVKLTGVP